jgi:hypothetical protein
MSAALAPLPYDHRTHAEEALIVETALSLEEHDEPELAQALRSCRVHLHPWRAKRERYRHGIAQYRVTLEAPATAWPALTADAAATDRLLRSEFGRTMRPLRFVRSLEVVQREAA